MKTLEAIDAEHIAELVSYLQEFVERLVTPIPEDTSALDTTYQRISEI